MTEGPLWYGDGKGGQVVAYDKTDKRVRVSPVSIVSNARSDLAAGSRQDATDRAARKRKQKTEEV